MGSLSAAIVGAETFAGAHLVRGFEARGARALPILDSRDGRLRAEAPVFDDITDEPALLAGRDAVVYAVDPTPAVRAASLDRLERMMRAASVAHVPRFVLVSSVGVYGFPSRQPVTERMPYGPRTPEAAAHVESEMRASRLARDLGIELVIARPSRVYGPGDPDGFLERMGSLMRFGLYRVIGDGENVLHHIHVDDVVEGLWLMATLPEAMGGHFILAGPETTTLAELSERVARTVGRPLSRRRVPSLLARAMATVGDLAAERGVGLQAGVSPRYHAKLDDLTRTLFFDITKAKAIGFSPRVAYDEGVARTLRGEWPALARAGADPG